MIYRVCRAILRISFAFMYRLKAEGKHHIPKDGPVILCANHRSNLDPPLLGTPVDRMVHYMAKAELFKIPGFGAFLYKLGAFPVKRGGVSKDSIRLALNLLEQQSVLGVFPEGTRSKGKQLDELGAGKKGAASLALRSGATVIPVAITGKYIPFISRIVVIYGEPVDMSEFAGQSSSETLDQATNKIMDAIRQLLREQRRV